jgi:hypothetical protein
MNDLQEKSKTAKKGFFTYYRMSYRFKFGVWLLGIGIPMSLIMAAMPAPPKLNELTQETGAITDISLEQKKKNGAVVDSRLDMTVQKKGGDTTWKLEDGNRYKDTIVPLAKQEEPFTAWVDSSSREVFQLKHQNDVIVKYEDVYGPKSAGYTFARPLLMLMAPLGLAMLIWGYLSYRDRDESEPAVAAS